MVRIQFAIDLQYELSYPGADFVFNIHAAQTKSQSIVSEQLQISQPVPSNIQTDPATLARYLRLTAAPGPLHISYLATVDIDQHVGDPDKIPETPVAQLPLSALAYIYPSRYCQSDRLANLAMREFGLLDKGYRRVEAIRNWVNQHVTFRGNTSNSATSALDTLTDRVGVCRDFAHLMIAICRALSIPARFTTGIDYGADPALGPTDSTPMSRFSSAAAGIFSTPREQPFRWVSSASAPAAMRPTFPSPPFLAASLHCRRSSR